jgi:hypothetical protein
MSRYSIRKPINSKEHILSKKVARALTEDFSTDIEGAGYYLSSDYPPIIFHRLETMYLAAKDEHDKIMGREVETEGFDKW